MLRTIEGVFRHADVDAVFTTREIADITGIKIYTVRTNLKKLIKEDKIMKLSYNGVIYYTRYEWFAVLEMMKSEDFTME